MKITIWENWSDRYWKGGELAGIFMRNNVSIDSSSIFTWNVYCSINWRERERTSRNVRVEQEFLILYQHRYTSPINAQKLTSFPCHWVANLASPVDITYWAREQNVSISIVQGCPLVILKLTLEQLLPSYQHVWYLLK